MSIREHIKQLKEQPETAAVGNRWTPEEEAQLIDALGNNKDVEEIAKDHRRTLGGIKSRMREIAVRMVEADGKSIDEVCEILHMTSDEIEDAQKRRAANNKTTAPKTKPETELDVLKDIRKLLVRIEATLLKE
jgi:DNA-directed RNA polymerase specialized sigma24 family protein